MKSTNYNEASGVLLNYNPGLEREVLNNKAIRIIAMGSGVAFLMALVASSAIASGIAVGPPTLQVSNAERGGEYKSTIYIKYTGDTGSRIELNAAGEISNWITFYQRDNPEIPVKYLDTEAGKWAYIIASFNIPSDAAPGDVNGTIYVKKASAQTEGGLNVNLQGKVDVTINVIDKVASTASGSSSLVLIMTWLGLPVIIVTAVLAYIVSRRAHGYAPVLNTDFIKPLFRR